MSRLLDGVRDHLGLGFTRGADKNNRIWIVRDRSETNRDDRGAGARLHSTEITGGGGLRLVVQLTWGRKYVFK